MLFAHFCVTVLRLFSSLCFIILGKMLINAFQHCPEHFYQIFGILLIWSMFLHTNAKLIQSFPCYKKTVSTNSIFATQFTRRHQPRTQWSECVWIDCVCLILRVFAQLTIILTPDWGIAKIWIWISAFFSICKKIEMIRRKTVKYYWTPKHVWTKFGGDWSKEIVTNRYLI